MDGSYLEHPLRMELANISCTEPALAIFIVEIFFRLGGFLVVADDNIGTTDVNFSARIRSVLDAVITFFPVD